MKTESTKQPQSTTQPVLVGSTAAPRIVDPERAKAFAKPSSGLPSEVDARWAGRYQLIHGTVGLREWRSTPDGKDVELVSTFYRRGAVLELDAVDASRFYALGVVDRIDDAGKVEDIGDLVDDDTRTRREALRREFAVRDAELLETASWGFESSVAGTVEKIRRAQGAPKFVAKTDGSSPWSVPSR